MTLLALLILVIAVVAALAVGLTVALVARGRKRTPLPEPRVDTEAPPVEVDAPPVTIEKPESTASRLVRLRQRLAGSQGGFGRGLLSLLSRERLDEDTWESIEDLLLSADLGVGPTQQVVEGLRTRLRVEGAPEDPRAALRAELVSLVDRTMDRRLQVSGADGKPGVVLVVGVNGTGKTTTVGKLARILVAEDRTVTLGAADTFRAAAVDQLATWGERVGVEVVRGAEAGDPASVAFDAVQHGLDAGVDTVIIDTAGRLQNKTDLMDELGKVKRVIEKLAPVTEVLLVIDATTGQNGLIQARVFSEVVDVTGVVLTKLDGSAKGGIVFAIETELGLPIKLVGLGETIGDLVPFDPVEFIGALFDD
jgi:fused signal recognition particle receptor